MSTPSLVETQRDLFSAITSPLRGRSRRMTDLPADETPHDPEFLAAADRYIRPSPTLIPAECLELYHRQYWFRLLDSIEEDFPSLVRLVGRERFWAIIEAYLLKHPSSSFTLRHLGSRLPEFLRTDDTLSDRDLRTRATAVAKIESSLMLVFEAPQLQPAGPEDVANRPFTLQPHVILLTQETPASEWIHDPDVGWPDTSGGYCSAVWRTPSGASIHAPLEAGEFRMLSRLTNRVTTLDKWLTRSAADIPEPGTLTSWFAAWQARQWFAVPGSNSQQNQAS